ncbi:MAG: hypothetical protein KGR25_11440 [Chloroflexi bacterium]|nr:hypothetical protein [Chloroflexota bacterium]
MGDKMIYSTTDHPAAPLRTQAEVAAILGISRASVHFDEKNALAKIKKGLLASSGVTDSKRGTHLESTANGGPASVSRRTIRGSQP